MENKKIFIHAGHREREKKLAISSDLSSYPEHKLIELLLFYSIPRKDTNETAHILLERFGSIRGLLNADGETLRTVPMVGDNSILLIKIIDELMRRYHLEETEQKRFDTVAKLGEYFIGKFIGVGVEQLYVMLLDDSLQMIDCRMIFEGSVSSAALDNKKIYEYICSMRASNVVFAHNHPRSIAVPSESDIEFTYCFATVLEKMGVRLQEHIIVSGDRYIPLIRNSDDRILRSFTELK